MYQGELGNCRVCRRDVPHQERVRIGGFVFHLKCLAKFKERYRYLPISHQWVRRE